MKHALLKKSITLLCLLSLLSVSAAKDETIPMDLIADTGNFDQLAGIGIYQGNVKVTQGDATIWADKLTVILKNNLAERLEAEAKNEQSPVRFHYQGDKQPIKGKGDKMIYQVADKEIILSGNAVIEQGEDVMKGKQLTYQLKEEIIKGSRVHITLFPKEKD